MTTIAFEKTALPIIGAPMAGGTTTPDLTAAVARAGGFPFVAGGYLTAEALAPLIDRMRETTENFGVNLFARIPFPSTARPSTPSPPPSNPWLPNAG